MIDSQIIEWLDFGDSIQKISSYSREYLELYFKFFRILIKNKPFPVLLDIILIILSFVQILCISTVFISSENDIILQIIDNLRNVFLIYNIIKNDKIYFKLFLIISIIILIDIILLITILLILKIEELRVSIKIFNLLNSIIFHYLTGPAIEICLISFWCEDKRHKYLNVNCFSDSTHIKKIIFSVIVGLFYIFISILYSLYYYEIGSITNKYSQATHISCNYELFYLIVKLIMFLFCFYLTIIKKKSFLLKIIYESIIFILCLIISIYININFYHYNNIINYLVYFGWYFCTWFSFCIIIKLIFNTKDIVIFVIFGWLIIVQLSYKYNKINNFLLLSEAKFFKIHNIKSNEKFIDNLLKLLEDKINIKSKILINGIIKNFEEFANNNPEINYHYQKLLNDKFLNQKYSKNEELPILSIIFLIYYSELDKSIYKQEIILYMCYFLINKFNNSVYTVYLCSKIKPIGHINQYHRYLLSEDIKEFLVYKKKDYKSIQNIQIGSIILYYLYMDLFKIKIYDAICYQINYFEIIKEHVMKKKTIVKFFKIGNMIFNLRREIMKIWEKITEINPFSDESYRDYKLYLDNILKDENLVQEESKKYILMKHEKKGEKYNVYNSMFLYGKSSIILVDGNISNGKILYGSPNFGLLFTYQQKELLNISIEDLLPSAVQTFHKDLIENAIKYSNINYIFKKEKLALLKNKNGGLINIKFLVKPVPNLCYGLIYFVYLQKIIDSINIITLDKDLKINGFTENAALYQIEKGFNLNQGMIGNHIATIIPDILFLLEYENGEFKIIKEDFQFKGNFYPINKMNKIKGKIDSILDKIKNNKIHNELNKENTFNNRNEEMLKELSKELFKGKIKPYNIFYKIKKYTFLEEKYKYYKLYITDNNSTNLIDAMAQITYSMSSKDKNNTYIISQKSISRDAKVKKEKQIRINKRHLTQAKNTRNITIITQNMSRELEQIKENQDNEKKSTPNQNKTAFFFQSGNLHFQFNNIKLGILNKKETKPIIFMFYLSIIFVITTISFIIYHEKLIENSFEKLSTFLDENIFFNMTKMGVAVLYITVTNIKWQLDSCNLESPLFNFTLINEHMLSTDVAYLKWIKNFINNFGIEFYNVVNEKYDIKIAAFSINKDYEEINYQLNNDNILNYFVNRGEHLLKVYPDLLNYFQFNIIKNLEVIELNCELFELNNLVNQTYLYLHSNINGFILEEKNKKTNKIFYNFPNEFIFNGVILFFLFFIYILYILHIYKIEIFFINKLINFNNNNLEIYLKNLDEIRKKMGNDNSENTDEEEKDIDSNEYNSIKNSLKEEENNLERSEIKKNKILNKINSRKNLKRYRNKQKKIKKLNSYFLSKNIFFGIKILLIIIIYLSYYILSIIIEKYKKEEFITFDAINDSMIGVFKELYDIFISFKRELDLYENSLINCGKNITNKTYNLTLPSPSDFKTPNLGNSIMEITTGLGHKSTALDNLTEIFTRDACKFLTNNQEEYTFCSEFFWNGILLEGLEQTIVKIGDIIKTIIEELDSLNIGAKTFNEILQDSTYRIYELFIELYYQKSYRTIDDFFWAIRKEKLYYILKIIRNLLYSYIIISIIFFFVLLYFIYNMKNLFNSFLNFIIILPQKHLCEDEDFYKDIIRISSDLWD